jgi:hypothetical protein
MRVNNTAYSQSNRLSRSGMHLADGTGANDSQTNIHQRFSLVKIL